MPDGFLAAAKFWTALAGAVVTAVLSVLPEDPQWLVIVSSVLTAAAVYFVPNREPAMSYGFLLTDDFPDDDDPSDGVVDVDDDQGPA